MNMLEKKVNTIMDLLLAVSDEEYSHAKKALHELKSYNVPAPAKSVREVIEQLLLDVGVPSNLSGHRYLVATIELCMEHVDDHPAATKVIYPTVAKEYNTTASKVERALRHAIEVAWSRGDWDALSRYFGNTVNPMSGRPTNSEFMWRLANVVLQTIVEG